MGKFDQLINEIGPFGRYQKWLVVTVLIVVIPGSINTNMPVFVLTIPKHRCAVPGYTNDTYEVQSPWHGQLVNESIPLNSKGDWSQCNLLEQKADGNFSEVACNSWVYDHEYFEMSIIEKLNLVCDRKVWRSHANMAMMLGKFVSALAQGYISDRFGRRRSLLIFIVVLIFNNTVNPFIYNDVFTLLFLRFLTGLATTSCYLNAFVIGLEFIGPEYRQTFNVAIATMWTAGGFLLTAFAYPLRDYQILMIASGAPSIFLLSYYFFIPESPRWLISKGRHKEALEVLQEVAKTNKREFPQKTFDEVVLEETEEEKNKEKTIEKEDGAEDRKETLWMMMGYKILAVRFVINLWNWAANSLTYYGTLFNVQNLSGSIYLNFALTNSVDLLGTFLMYLLVDRFGRKKMYDLFLLTASLACMATIFPILYASENVSDIVITTLSMMGRMCISTSFNILYLYCAEMFPTGIRNQTMGVSSMVSRVGSISAPYIADLGILLGGDLQDALPLLVFGGAGFVAFVSALSLPETNGTNLPDTIQDALEIGRTSPGSKAGQTEVGQMAAVPYGPQEVKENGIDNLALETLDEKL